MKYAMSILMVACCALALVSPVAFADECSMPSGKCDMMGKADGMSSERFPGKHEMGRDGKGHGEMFLHMTGFILAKATEIGLSEDQVSKVEALRYGIEKNSIKQNADVATLDLDIREALKKDAIDINAVTGLVDQKFVIEAQKAKDDITAFANLKKILTKDQEKKLKDLRKDGMMARREFKPKEGQEDQDRE